MSAICNMIHDACILLSFPDKKKEICSYLYYIRCKFATTNLFYDE